MDATSIINLCMTNKQNMNLCNDPELWRYLLKRDYNVEYYDPRDLPYTDTMESIFDLIKKYGIYSPEYNEYIDSDLYLNERYNYGIYSVAVIILALTPPKYLLTLSPFK